MSRHEVRLYACMFAILLHSFVWMRVSFAQELEFPGSHTPYITSSEFLVNEEDVHSSPYVLDPAVVLDEELDIETLFLPTMRPKAAKMWTYSDGDGRVRILLDTDISSQALFEPKITIQGTGSFPEYQTYLRWSRTFEKGAEDSKTTATILPSFLRLYAPFYPPGSIERPFADWMINIKVSYFGPDYTNERGESVRPTVSIPSLYQSVHVDGITGTAGISDFNEKHVSILNGEKFYGKDDAVIPIDSYVSTLNEAAAEGFVPAGTFRYETSRHTHELNLDAVEVGGKYTVSYTLALEGATYDDQFIWGYIGDPLDVESPDSGIRLDTADLPSDEPIRGLNCSELPNTSRYSISADGTVADQQTGLMWQRCPINFTIDDSGTTDITSDDRCVPDSGAELTADWQSSLLKANGASFAGRTDWRAPNIKELETLVSSHCQLPATETDAFPDTPIDAAFWSSTSGRYVWQQYINPADIAADAWQVAFASGDLQTADKLNAAYLRLVRDNGLPLAPLPALRAGRAQIDEGDSGSQTLVMPVSLTPSSSETVTVDYAVIAPNANAIDGVDFDSSTGTLSFLPGETVKDVAITVYGNIDAGNDKTLYLNLSNPSSNARMAVPTGIGTIFDDDPVISLGPAAVQEYEGSPSRIQQEIRVPVYLDRPALGTITVDYQLQQETAEFGSDIAGVVNGTVTFNTGESVTYVVIEPVNDIVPENDETVIVEVSNPVGAKLEPGFGDTLRQTVVLIDDDGPGTYTALNDTGVTTCASEADNGVPCPQPGLPMQDAETGRDANPTTYDPSDGDVGFSFTKIAADGGGLTSDASVWSCVNDNVTGLLWEVKTANISSPVENNDLHSSRWTYTWYNSSGINTGGYSGVQNGGECIDAVNCDTEKFIAAVNAEAFCGYTDWRLPTIDELYSIVDLTGDFTAQLKYADGPDGTTGYFKFAQFDNSSGPWSSSTAAGRDGGVNAWYLSENGMRKQDKGELRATPFPVRLVRGGITQPPP